MRLLFVCLLLLASSHLFAKGLCQDCNVVVIALDALQAKHVHILGAQNNTTPNLDELAGHATLFTQAISPSSWTVPTYLSILTSMYPSQHGLTNRYLTYTKTEKKIANFKNLKPDIVTMAEVFKKHGYKTGAFTGDSGFSKVLGYDKGFDHFYDDTQFGGLGDVAGRALDWVKQNQAGRFFLVVHGYDTHGQFHIAQDFKSRFWDASRKTRFAGTAAEQGQLREAGLKGEFPKLSTDEIEFWRAWYDGKIADADERMGQFLKSLNKMGALKKTLVVVLSDHGTEFVEHGRFDHGHSLYDELVHIPFLISLPNQKKANKVTQQVSTLDLLPTLLDIEGFAPEASLKKQMQGQSLALALNGGVIQGEDVYCETDYRNFTHKRALRSSSGWKYIMTLETGKEELYDLEHDPGETKNLTDTQVDRRKSLKDQLMKHLNEMPVQASTQTDCLPVYAGQCE